MEKKSKSFKSVNIFSKRIKICFILLIITFIPANIFAVDIINLPTNSSKYKFSFTTSWHSFLNWEDEDDNLQMYQLHFGYQLTDRDKIELKGSTWKMDKPLGVQLFDPHFMKDSEKYPGRLLEYGIGISYQRLLWKYLFAAIEILPLKQEYMDFDGEKIMDGFRLYTSYHIGYKFKFFDDRFFIAPQVHCNYWPIMTEGPEGFQEIENRDWSKNYFLFEPNIYFGINF